MSQKYSEMSKPQRWQWHAEVYALRRVMLGVHAMSTHRPVTQRASGTTRMPSHAPKRNCALNRRAIPTLPIRHRRPQRHPLR